MRATVSYVRCPDEVVELRIGYGEREVLSHINDTHLERVRKSRMSFQGMERNTKRVGTSTVDERLASFASNRRFGWRAR